MARLHLRWQTIVHALSDPPNVQPVRHIKVDSVLHVGQIVKAGRVVHTQYVLVQCRTNHSNIMPPIVIDSRFSVGEHHTRAIANVEDISEVSVGKFESEEVVFTPTVQDQAVRLCRFQLKVHRECIIETKPRYEIRGRSLEHDGVVDT